MITGMMKCSRLASAATLALACATASQSVSAAGGGGPHDVEVHGAWTSNILGSGTRTGYQAAGPNREGGIWLFTPQSDCPVELVAVRFRVESPSTDIDQRIVEAQFRVDENPAHHAKGAITGKQKQGGDTFAVAGFLNIEKKPALLQEMESGRMLRGLVEVPWDGEPRHFSNSLDGAGAAIARMRTECRRDARQAKKTVESSKD